MIYKCSGNLTKTFLSPIGGRKVFCQLNALDRLTQSSLITKQSQC